MVECESCDHTFNSLTFQTLVCCTYCTTPASNVGKIDSSVVLYENDDCSGSAFAYPGTPQNFIFRTFDNKILETGHTVVEITRNATGSDSCLKQMAYTQTAIVTTEIDYALPFTLPIMYPLKFVAENKADVNGDGVVRLEDAVNALRILTEVR